MAGVTMKKVKILIKEEKKVLMVVALVGVLVLKKVKIVTEVERWRMLMAVGAFVI